MARPVASPAQRDQVVLSVIAEVTAGSHVVYFQSSRCAARLAAPPVPLQDGLTQSAVGLRIQASPRTFRSKHSQEALFRLSRNCCF
jgi:hypothetical protein